MSPLQHPVLSRHGLAKAARLARQLYYHLRAMRVGLSDAQLQTIVNEEPMNPPHPEDSNMQADLEAQVTAPAPQGNPPDSYTVTDDAITVVIGGMPKVITAGTPQYAGLRLCLREERWADLPGYLTRDGALARWLGTDFRVENGKIFDFTGAELPQGVADKIIAMATGSEDPTPLLNFYKRLANNPSRRSVQQLFQFLGHMGIPIEPDGTFLAYKGVREDFLDQYSGTLNNTPGTTLRMPRNQISDDPNQGCHEGLHVGALNYARGFSSRVVICRIDPANVVCVPYDYNFQKMRVCEYEVIGQWVGQDEATTLPSTTWRSAESANAEQDSDDWGGEVEYEGEDLVECDEYPDEEAEEVAKPSFDGYPAQYEGDAHDMPPAVQAPTPVRAKVALTSTAPKAASFNRKSPKALMEETLEDLRAYAGKHLKIVGAYHIPGGKSKLVSAILKARRKRASKRGRK